MEINYSFAGAWLSAGLTLFIFSFLYKDNPLFKLAEHVYIGVTVGYSIVLLIFGVWLPKIVYPFSALDFSPLLPCLAGLMLFARFSPKLAWLSRYPFAFIMGYGAGVAAPAVMATSFLKQLEAAVKPWIGQGGFSWAYFISGFIITAGTVSVISYFFFSLPRKGIIKPAAKAGIYFLMVYLGASFGATVMARFALLQGKVYELALYSSQVYAYAAPVLVLFTAVFLTLYAKKAAGKAKEESGK